MNIGSPRFFASIKRSIADEGAWKLDLLFRLHHAEKLIAVVIEILTSNSAAVILNIEPCPEASVSTCEVVTVDLEFQTKST